MKRPVSRCGGGPYVFGFAATIYRAAADAGGAKNNFSVRTFLLEKTKSETTSKVSGSSLVLPQVARMVIALSKSHK